MELIEGILTRKSVRKFTSQPVEDEKIRTILTAAMSGPSCTNARDWSFIVVKDKQTLNAMADANGRPAEPLRNAAFAVLVLGDYDRAFPRAQDYWVIDGSIAAQNMALAAHGLGLGSVWLGTWPQMDRVYAQKELFDLPNSVIPHSILAFGYPESDEAFPERDLYEEDRVHFEKW